MMRDKTRDRIKVAFKWSLSIVGILVLVFMLALGIGGIRQSLAAPERGDTFYISSACDTVEAREQLFMEGITEGNMAELQQHCGRFGQPVFVAMDKLIKVFPSGTHKDQPLPTVLWQVMTLNGNIFYVVIALTPGVQGVSA